MLRVVFMGSPGFAVPTLAAIRAAGHEIACVYSQPPRPAGRGREVRRTAVHEAAEMAGIPVRTPLNFKSEADRDDFASLGADVAVVVAYGLLLPKAVLAAPRLGCFNLHGSLLPRWRGAAPIQRAVMAGDAETGVQVMRMEAGLDTGPVLATARTPIGPDDTTADVHDRLSALGAALMVQSLADLEAGRAVETPQTEDGLLYAAKITPEEAHIDWARPAHLVSAHIRGLSPSPGAWFEVPGQGAPLRVKALLARAASEEGSRAADAAPGTVLDQGLLIACQPGAVRLTRLQRAGKGPMAAADFLRGTPIAPGTVLV